MNEFNMLPIYRQGINEISDGIDIHIPEFCNKNCGINEKCLAHYKAIYQRCEGLYICPYGFNTYIQKNDNEVIFTCFRVKDYYDKKKADPKIKNENSGNNFFRILDINALNNYIEAYNIYYNNTQKYDIYNNFVEDVLHDIRKYNLQLKAKIDRLFRKMQGNSRKYYDMLDITKSINEIAWFFTLRINSYDFIYNENVIAAIPPGSYNIHNLFFKIKECIKERANEKNINIILKANRECRNFTAFECIELLPYILLDNAIKYAPRNTEINIYIDEHATYVKISVTSIGPIVKEDENEKLCKRGFRGINAKSCTSDGQGIGLYTAKRICDMHKAKLHIKCSQEIVQTIKKVNYGEFTIDIDMAM